MQGCRHHVYAPLQKSCSLGRRTSSHPRRRRWRTFKVTPSGMPWTYVSETPRNKVDMVLRCVRRAPALDGRACRAPRSPRCHRASARPCRDDCLGAPAVDAGGSDDLGRFVCHVSNRRGNPTLTFLEGGGPCIHTCRAESMHRYRPPCPACGGRCALKGLRPMRAGHAPGSPRCLRVYVRPRPRPRDDRRPRPRPDPTARRARFVLHAPAGG